MQANRFLVCIAILYCAIGFAQLDSGVVKNEDFKAATVNQKYLPSPENSRTFKKDFKQKYSGREFVYEHKALQKSLWEKFKDWLASLIARMFKMTKTESSMKLLDIVLKAIAVIVVLFVAYLIYRIYRNKESSWIFAKKNSAIDLDGESIVDIKSANFEMLIENAIETGNRRLAIRYYYLLFLQKLSNRKLISWDPEKTTLDYERELKDSQLKEEFSYLSYLYDHTWYGDIEFDQSVFDNSAKSFNNAMKKLR